VSSRKKQKSQTKSSPEKAPAASTRSAVATAKKKGPAEQPQTPAQPSAGEAPVSKRLALIRARHETMKREIAQIREDLESEEDV
jgi:hypothetical protein